MTDAISEPRIDDESWAGPWGTCRRLLPVGSPQGHGYRRKGCGAPSVAALRRGTRTGGSQRWGYCARHLADYGRVVRDSAVWWDPAAALVVLESYGRDRDAGTDPTLVASETVRALPDGES